MLRERVVSELVAMQDDCSIKVRRELVLRLAGVSKIIGDDFFIGVILPMFKQLSNDQIWSVRKACVEILPSLTQLSNQKIKERNIIRLFTGFSQDSSRLVKQASF